MYRYEFTFEFENKEIICTILTCTIYSKKRELEKDIKFYIRENYGSDFKIKSIRQIL